MLQNIFHLGSSKSFNGSKRSGAAFYGFITGSYNTLAIPLPLRTFAKSSTIYVFATP